MEIEHRLVLAWGFEEAGLGNGCLTGTEFQLGRLGECALMLAQQCTSTSSTELYT